jgi:hypothetical protein
MSTATVKACSLGRRIYFNVHSFGRAIALLMMLWGCTTPSFRASNVTWKTYTNNRYGFEFPYPSNWNISSKPENDDGIAFVSPENNTVEIRAWASNRLDPIIPPDKTKTSVNPNFKTAQGIPGVMVVEVGQEISSITLTITHDQVKYNWRGQSPSQDFTNYYRFFSYIARQYKVRK